MRIVKRQFEDALAEHYDKAFEEFCLQEVQSLPKKAKMDILTRLTLQRLVSVFTEPGVDENS